MAAELGSRFSLDSAELLACSQNVTQAATDLSYALEMGIGSTPALLVRDVNGRTYDVSDRSLEGIRMVLAEARANAPGQYTGNLNRSGGRSGTVGRPCGDPGDDRTRDGNADSIALHRRYNGQCHAPSSMLRGMLR